MLKILLALDLSPHSRRAAEYVARVAPHLPRCSVTALVVSSGIPYNATTEAPFGLDLAAEPEVHGYEDHWQEVREVQTFLEEVKALFVENGLAQEAIHLRIKPLGRGVAMDILDEAQIAGCDTIVVGRRGITTVQSLLMGSVSSTVVKNAEGRTVWVVE
jgi:nucleotide-binding universal stress UspA family protein